MLDGWYDMGIPPKGFEGAHSTPSSNPAGGFLRSVKYEEVYLHAYEGVAAARTGLSRYFRFYNAERRHQGLGRRTPDVVYLGSSS